MRQRRFRSLALLLLAASVGTGCAATGRAGEANSYLIVNSLLASSGAAPGELQGTLASDVQTVVDGVPTVFADDGVVEFTLAMKNPALAATQTNFITIRRYVVTFRRSDGRNVPGVDVPYGFEGAITMTVDGANSTPATFTLVRTQAKVESPLAALAGGGGAFAISTLAEVTFFGTDQAGREVSVKANISVNFADWGDPQ